MTNDEVWDEVEKMSPDYVTAFLFANDKLRKADLILVLGNSSEVLSRQRARRAAELFKQGLAPVIVVSGGRTSGIVAEAQWMGDEIVNKAAVPTQAVLIEAKSKTTQQNSEFVRKMLEEQGLLKKGMTVILVSCPWHMARARHRIEAEFPDWQLVCSPHQESCTAKNWMNCPDCVKLIQGVRGKKFEAFYAVSQGVPRSKYSEETTEDESEEQEDTN